MFTNEIWLPVVDYEGLYSISSTGRLRSEQRVIKRGKDRTVTIPEKILATPPNHDGYPVCTLHRNGQQTSRYIHTLVARAFYGEPRPGQEVRHLNDVKDDCRVENLAFGRRSDNALDSVRNGTHPQASKTHCVHGHPFDDANSTRHPSRPNRRVCLPCRRESNRRYRTRKAQVVAA